MMGTLSEPVANAIYDILIADAGAEESGRQAFVLSTKEGITEYRFQGKLGFGGKFWIAHGRWYVNAYPEDEDGLAKSAIVKINRELTTLKSFLAEAQ